MLLNYLMYAFLLSQTISFSCKGINVINNMNYIIQDDNERIKHNSNNIILFH